MFALGLYMAKSVELHLNWLCVCIYIYIYTHSMLFNKGSGLALQTLSRTQAAARLPGVGERRERARRVLFGTCQQSDTATCL